MTSGTSALQDTPEGIAAARRQAIAMVLVEQAMADGEFLEALVVAAANAIGLRSRVVPTVQIDDVLDVMRGIATAAVEANRQRVLQ